MAYKKKDKEKEEKEQQRKAITAKDLKIAQKNSAIIQGVRVKLTEAQKQEKIKALQKTVADINKVHGEGKVVCGKDVARKSIYRFPIFSPIDKITGGGLPIGRIIEIYGLASSGKTSLCNIIQAKCLENNLSVGLIEMDNSLDLEGMAQMGVDIDSPLFYLCQPESSEQALDEMDQMIRSHNFDLVLIDCIAMLSPAEEQEKGMDENPKMAGQAQLFNRFLRKAVSGLQAENLKDESTYNNTMVILVNQIRSGMAGSWGSNEVRPGGMGKDFAASLRIKVSKPEVHKLIDSEGNVFGFRAILSTKKSKICSPFQEVTVDISHKHGGFYTTKLLFEAMVKEKDIKVAKNKEGEESKGWYTWDSVGEKDKKWREKEILDWLDNPENKKLKSELEVKFKIL